MTSTCVICNEPIELLTSRRISVVEPIIASDDFDPAQLPKAYDVHPECLKKVAHPEFALTE